jgi:hypothetical protein
MTKLRKRAAADLGCREDLLKGKELDENTYHVWGCSKRATYLSVCTHATAVSCSWVLNSDVEAYGVLAELERQEQQPRPAAPAHTSTAVVPAPDASIETGRAADGAEQLKLFIRKANAGWLLYINVTPAGPADHALVIWRLPKTHPDQACEIKVVADGQRIESARARASHCDPIHSTIRAHCRTRRSRRWRRACASRPEFATSRPSSP